MNLKSINELKKLNILFEIINTPVKTHTSEDARNACNCDISQIVKTLLFVGKKPIIVLVSGDKKVDLDKLRKIYDDASLRIATKEEVEDITGYTVGVVCPFGLKNKVEMIADTSLKRNELLVIASGKEDILFKISLLEFLKYYKGLFESVTK